MGAGLALALVLVAAVSDSSAARGEAKPETHAPPAASVVDLAPLPARSIHLEAPETAVAGAPMRVRISVIDAAGRPVRGPLPRPIFASSLGVEPILGRGVWMNGAAEERVVLARPGLGRILAVRVDEIAAEKRIDVLPSPRSQAALLAEAEDRLAAGDAAGALVSLRAAAEIGPPTPELLMRTGEAEIRLGRWDEARDYFRRAFDLTIRKPVSVEPPAPPADPVR